MVVCRGGVSSPERDQEQRQSKGRRDRRLPLSGLDKANDVYRRPEDPPGIQGSENLGTSLVPNEVKLVTEDWAELLRLAMSLGSGGHNPRRGPVRYINLGKRTNLNSRTLPSAMETVYEREEKEEVLDAKSSTRVSPENSVSMGCSPGSAPWQARCL